MGEIDGIGGNLRQAVLLDLGSAITPVPEPASFALLLAGLCLLGLVDSRRG